jgi:hypothetical protein
MNNIRPAFDPGAFQMRVLYVIAKLNWLVWIIGVFNSFHKVLEKTVWFKLHVHHAKPNAIRWRIWYVTNSCNVLRSNLATRIYTRIHQHKLTTRLHCLRKAIITVNHAEFCIYQHVSTHRIFLALWGFRFSWRWIRRPSYFSDVAQYTFWALFYGATS